MSNEISTRLESTIVLYPARSRLLLLLLLAAVCVSDADDAVQEWVQRYNHRTDSDDRGSCIATDGAGNVVVAGYTDEGTSGKDILVIKYSSSGVALWTNRYDGPHHSTDQPTAVALDSSGNIFIAGFSVGSVKLYAGGALDDEDYVTIAYSSGGIALWTNRYTGPGQYSDRANAVAVDDSGNIFVTGFSYAGTRAYTTVAYSANGTALWTNRYHSMRGDDEAKGVAVTKAGTVVVTGCGSCGRDQGDYVTIAYSTTGFPLWTNRYDGPSREKDEAIAVTAAPNGNIIVTGFSAPSAYTTIAYSSYGEALWTNRYQNAYGNGEPRALAVDANANVFVTGISWSPFEGRGYATVAYSGAGVPLWTNWYDTASSHSDDQPAI